MSRKGHKENCQCCCCKAGRKEYAGKNNGMFKDIIGKRFGKLVVIKLVKKPDKYKKRGGTFWLCKCDCGKFIVVWRGNLRGGKQRACGCLQHRADGWAGSKLYAIFQNMLQRCYNLNHKNYKYYGNKGIKVCSKWKDNFIAFKDWALSHGYKEGLSIHRKDNNESYTPKNCQWETRSQNSKNMTLDRDNQIKKLKKENTKLKKQIETLQEIRQI